jgi:hypothetical protein
MGGGVGGCDAVGDGHGYGQMVLLFRADLMKRREVEVAAVMRWVINRIMVIWFSYSGLT